MNDGNFNSLALARSWWLGSRTMATTSGDYSSDCPELTFGRIWAYASGKLRSWWWIALGFIGLARLAQMGRNRTGSGNNPGSNTSGSSKFEIEELIEFHCASLGLDIHATNVCKAICAQESTFRDLDYVGSAGEIGPMQVTPPAMIDMQFHIDLGSSLSDKIYAGCNWFKHLLDRAQAQIGRPYGQAGIYTIGAYRLAIRAYNAGFDGAVRGRGFSYLSDVKGQGYASWV